MTNQGETGKSAAIEAAKLKARSARYRAQYWEAQVRHLEEEQRLSQEQKDTRERLNWLVEQINEMDLNEITKIIEERKSHAGLTS